ncbi:hypothetical protein QQP08_014681 [Theobroma cacao]|nr:hypothetical protein QQP08_014681 [Theobroma cacao]
MKFLSRQRFPEAEVGRQLHTKSPKLGEEEEEEDREAAVLSLSSLQIPISATQFLVPPPASIRRQKIDRFHKKPEPEYGGEPTENGVGKSKACETESRRRETRTRNRENGNTKFHRSFARCLLSFLSQYS